MPTLQELMDNMDLLGEKVASEQTFTDPALETLATEAGLVGGGEKVASPSSLEGLYGAFFPEDVSTFVSEKTAEEEKVAAYQEALGARAHDYFAASFDARLDKLASEVLTGSATISAPAAHGDPTSHRVDPTPGQQLPNDMHKRDNGGKPLNVNSTTVTDEISKTNDSRTVGDYQQRPIGKTASALELAVRKQLLLANLDR